MKKPVLKYLFLSLCLMVTSTNAIAPAPDITLLWNQFIEVKSHNGYALGLTDEGVAVLEYDTLQDVFVQVNQMFLSTGIKSGKNEKGILVVRHADDHLSYVDINNLPELSLRGESYPDVDYADFALRDSELYLSRWFGGIDKFSVLDSGELDLLAYDTSGVLMTQLETDGTFLLALDRYNGLLRYDLTRPFGQSMERLLVDERTFAFAQVDSVFAFSLNSSGVLIGEFYGSTGRILDSIADIPSPQKVLHTGDRIIFLSQRQAHVFGLPDYEPLTEINIQSHRVSGDLVNIEDTTMLLLPFEEGGLTIFDIEGHHRSWPVLDRPGPITAIELDHNRLFTGGWGNPLEMYSFDSNGITEVQLIRDSSGLTDLIASEGWLYVLYPNYDNSLFLDISDVGGTPHLSGGYHLLTGGESEILLGQKGIDGYRDVFISGRDFIDAYSWFAQGYRHSGHWEFPAPLTSFSFIDTTLYVADRFGELSGYRDFPWIYLTECDAQDLVGTAWKTLVHDNRLFAFAGNTLTIISDCIEIDSVIYLPLPVLDAQISNDTLYTVGAKGIAVYNLDSGLPVQLESGGLGGSRIAVDDGSIATTDGSAIHLYLRNMITDSSSTHSPIEQPSAVLFDNFPEPFNISTTLQYQLLAPAEIDLSVYNLLGQKIRTLTSGFLPAGTYQASWDGHDRNGSEVSSGVYFYRLQTLGESISRKMMLLK